MLRPHQRAVGLRADVGHDREGLRSTLGTVIVLRELHHKRARFRRVIDGRFHDGEAGPAAHEGHGGENEDDGDELVHWKLLSVVL